MKILDNLQHGSQGHSQGLTSRAGMTLIEIIIVIALIAMVTVYALPNLGYINDTEVQAKINRLVEDIQSAYDIALLSKKPHRIVFYFKSGEYYLEEGESWKEINFGKDGLDADLTEKEESDQIEKFKLDFKSEYESLAGESYKNPETDEEIPPTSPVIEAKNRLTPQNWKKVVTLEWGVRKLGPELIVKALQADHHRVIQRLEDAQEESRAMIYFFASGNTERAMIHIAYRSGFEGVDDQKEPYTLIVNPYTGKTTVTSGAEEIDVHEAFDEE